jgi:hypothetical protein
MRHYDTGIGKRPGGTPRRLVAAAALILAAQILFAGIAAAAPRENSRPADAAALLPEIEGFEKDGEPQVFAPETLFEYIDGAADAYLAYEFEELAVLSYNGENKRSITVEIYRHSDLRNAFGIYAQERPQQGDFVPVGTEGYYAAGILNFFHGPFYVKTMGFELANGERTILTAAAEDIAARIGGEAAFPELLACFHREGRIAHSERYFARDVLGHGFLRCAYSADYVEGGLVVRLYLFEGKDEADARQMLNDYLKLAGTESPPRPGSGPTETYRFADPRRAEADAATFTLSGRFLWGMFGPAGAEVRVMERLESNLRERGFIE